MKPTPFLCVGLIAVMTVACADAPQNTAPPRSAPPAGTDPALPAGHPPVDAGKPDLPAGHPSMDTGAAPAPANVGRPISGIVDAAPSVKAKVALGKALFVIARKATTREIVAVRREEGVAIPHSFQISGADAMVAGTAFDGPLDLTARVSLTGDAMPGAGDVEGTVAGVLAGSSNVKIVLETVRP